MGFFKEEEKCFPADLLATAKEVPNTGHLPFLVFPLVRQCLRGIIYNGTIHAKQRAVLLKFQ